MICCFCFAKEKLSLCTKSYLMAPPKESNALSPKLLGQLFIIPLPPPVIRQQRSMIRRAKTFVYLIVPSVFVVS